MTATEAMIDIDPASLENTERYKLLIGSILPRPIALVSTLSPEGVPNLAPFSFFTAVCSSPMIICFSPMIRVSTGEKKDTLRNIEATGEFVVHVVTEDFVEKMNLTSGEYPFGVNEFEISGLTQVPSLKVKPFRVKESPIQMECTLNQIVNLGEHVGAGSLVIGEVVAFHVSPEIYENGRIITEKLKPVARLAGTSYAKTSDTFNLERPTVL